MRKYLGKLIASLTLLKQEINEKQRRMEVISMEDIQKKWDLLSADGKSTIELDLSWVGDKQTLDIIRAELEAHNAVVVNGMSELHSDISDVKNVVNGVRDDLAQANQSIDKLISILKEHYNIYDGLELSSDTEIENWTYILDPVAKSVTLGTYNGTDENVAVYDRYIIDGVKYKTKLGNGFSFKDKAGIKSIAIGDNVDSSTLTSLKQVFYNNKSLESIEFGKSFDTHNVTDMSETFYNCIKLENLDLSGWDTSNVTTMAGMFRVQYQYGIYNNQVIKNLTLGNKWNTSNVTDMSSMFSTSHIRMDDNSYDIFKLFDTHNVTDMSSMFSYSQLFKNLNTNIIDLSEWDVSKVTNMKDMLLSAEWPADSVYNISGWKIPAICENALVAPGVKIMNNCDFSAISSFYETGFYSGTKFIARNSKFGNTMAYAFCPTSNIQSYQSNNLTEIDLSGADLSNVTSMYCAFYGSAKLLKLDLSDIITPKNLTNMERMFIYCSSIESLDLTMIDVSKVTNMQLTFYSCSKLTEVLVSKDKWVISENCNTTNMFGNKTGCSEVTYVDAA